MKLSCRTSLFIDQQIIEQVIDPLGSETLSRIQANESLLTGELLAYYQSADYILENRLNRWP